MTQQVINVGTVPNDRTGDTARAAFVKTNANFTEQYSRVAALEAGIPASLVSYSNAGSGLSSVQLQAAVDEILAKRVRPNILLSERFGLVGDNSTANDTFMDDWINEQLNLIAAGKRVQMVLGPGIYRYANPKTIDGRTDILFDNAIMRYNGSSFLAPALTWGNAGGSFTNGKAIDIYVDNIATHNHYNRNFVGFRMMNKSVSAIRIAQVGGFTVNAQLAADGFSSYNCIDMLSSTHGQTHLELCSLVPGTPFCSENSIRGGNIQGTSGFIGFGSCFAMVLCGEYETGYHGNSGNYWLKPSTQIGSLDAGYTWVSGITYVAHKRYTMGLSGQEYLCKVGGVAGTVEPSVEPNTDDATRVDLNNVITAANNVNITVSSTTGISAGWHMRGSNPLSCFPFDTYVVAVTDATHLQMSQPAASTSTIYRATFIAPTIDGAATLVFVGYTRRSMLWHRDSFGASGIREARRETGAGEAHLVSGAHMWPRFSSAGAGNETEITGEGVSAVTIKDCRHPVWVAGRTYSTSNRMRPRVLGTTFAECTTGGAAHASAEPVLTGKPGNVIIDNAVTWIERAMMDSTTYGDMGMFTGGGLGIGPRAKIHSYADPPMGNGVSPALPMQMGAVGSSLGWMIAGYCKSSSAGVLSQSFAFSDFAAARDGVLCLSQVIYGFLINTRQHRYFRLAKNYGTYTINRGAVVAYDKAYRKMDVRSDQYDGGARLHCAQMTVGGSFVIADPNDFAVSESNLMVGADIPYVFFGAFRGSTGTPIMLTASSLRVTALPYCLTPNQNSLGNPNRAEIFTLLGAPPGVRYGLGSDTVTPAYGIFQCAGEYIHNGLYASGKPQGWTVSTIGYGGLPWTPGGVVYKEQFVSNRGLTWAANGSFTNNATAITFTGALTTATSGTLTGNWAGATGSYVILFSDGSLRDVTLTNGSASVAWSVAVTATASATAGAPPTTTVQNIVDASATSVVTNNVATYDYMGVTPVLTAASNWA